MASADRHEYEVLLSSFDVHSFRAISDSPVPLGRSFPRDRSDTMRTIISAVRSTASRNFSDLNTFVSNSAFYHRATHFMHSALLSCTYNSPVRLSVGNFNVSQPYVGILEKLQNLRFSSNENR